MIGSIIAAIGKGMFWLFFVLCLGGGCVCIFLQFRAFRRAHATRSWPRVEGVITQASVEKIISIDAEGQPSRSYAARIAYRYEAAGKSLTQSRIRFGTGIYNTGFRFYPRRLLKNYAVQQSVSVFYDPSDPSNSVLEQGRSGWEHSIFAALLFGFAGMFWAMVIRYI